MLVASINHSVFHSFDYASENHAPHLLGEALDSDLQEMLVRSDLLTHLPILQLVHVPIGQYKTAVQEPCVGGRCPNGKVTRKIFCPGNFLVWEHWLMMRFCALTVVELDATVLVGPSLSRRLGENATRVEANDLHVLRLGIFGDLLQKQGTSILGKTVGWPLWAHCRPHVGGNSRDISEVLFTAVLVRNDGEGDRERGGGESNLLPFTGGLPVESLRQVEHTPHVHLKVGPDILQLIT